MSQFYLEKNGPQRDQKIAENELRGQLNTMLPHSSFKGKLNPATERIEVLQSLAPAIYREFKESAEKAGQLVVEEYVDNRGLTCRRFHGDSRAGLEGFAEGGRRVKLSELSHFEGRAYLRGREPRHIRAQMLLRSRGLD